MTGLVDRNTWSSAPLVTLQSRATLGSISSSRCQTSCAPPDLSRARADYVSHERAICRRQPPGGARRDRTDDLLLAKQALSQLSYGPVRGQRTDDGGQIQSAIRRLSSVFC